MSARLPAALGAALLALALAAPSALAAEAPDAPALSVTSLATPTAFIPNDASGEYTYDIRVANLGAKATDTGGTITIADTLPAGLTVDSVELKLRSGRPAASGGVFDYAPEACLTAPSGGHETVTCTLSNTLFEAEEPEILAPTEERRLLIHLTPGALVEGQTLTNHVAVSGGGAPPESVDTDNLASSDPAPAGLSFFRTDLTGPDGLPVGQAASHPYQLTVGFAVNTRTPPPGAEADFVPAGGDVKNIRTTLPPGLIGNPTAANTCTAQRFNTFHSIALDKGPLHSRYEANGCPPGSAVGVVLAQEIDGRAGVLAFPLYNLVPPPGMPAQFGTQLLGLPFFIDLEVRPDDHYKVVATLRNLSQAKRLVASTVVIWGTPADGRHDEVRGECLVEPVEAFGIALANVPGKSCAGAPGIPEKPSLRLPTNCANPFAIEMGIDTWSDASFSASSAYPTPTGCDQVPFEASLQARPTTDVADSPSGLHANLHIPQSDHEAKDSPGIADLRKTVVSLPEGLVLNPSSANGLDACTEAEVGYLGKDQGADLFSNAPATCPDAARVGDVAVHTPLLDHPVNGSVYVAMPHENPFDSLLAIYIAAHDPRSGVVVKLAGKVDPDPLTGRLTATFDETPQVPFEDFDLDFFAGPTAALRTPAICAPYSTDSLLTPWSAPGSGPPLASSDPYAITRSPSGAPCPTAPGALPNSPSFKAGTIAPIAATASPLVVNLRREDGSAEFGSLTLTPPPGLLARLAGIPYCPEAALAAAAAKSGRAEENSPSCPAASLLGTVTVGAGAGPAPYYTTGKAYLTAPYKGAPLSLAIITPAAAGPYDLGTVVVRTALRVDPETTRITAVSDPIPHILKGIPLDVRSVAVRLDHPGWGVNPTNCNPFTFAGQEVSTLGQAAALSDRFQVGECKRLKFAPRLSLRLKGGTKRGDHPSLRAELKMPAAGANIARASVALPHSEFLEQAHIRTICTRVQFAAEACPPAAIYGKARVFSPLLDAPLEGPVYLRSSSHPLPDLVFDLRGQIHVALVGRIDSVNGGIRAVFDPVPDAPVSKVVLQMRGAKKGLFVNSRDICKHTAYASAEYLGQNGKAAGYRPALKASCGGKAKKAKKGR